MGLIKATVNSIKTVLEDQWIDYFYCESIPEDILAVKGEKRVHAGSSNKKGTENYITSGSVLAISDGQCMVIVEQGRVIEVCSEPGEYIFDSDKSQGIFTETESGPINLIIEKSKRRFSFGGQAALDQRVYYFNTKEIVGNRFGTPTAIPFRVIDRNVGIDMDVSLTCFGTFSYRITNPVLFYKNVTGNIASSYNREHLDKQIEAEVITAIQPAFAKLSVSGIRYSELPSHTQSICMALNEILSKKWRDLRGIEVVSFNFRGLKVKEEDEKMLKELQRNAVFKDPTMAAAQLVGAQADAMKAAAANQKAGAAAAFIGMNLASNAGGINANELFKSSGAHIKRQPNSATDINTEAWKCKCGALNSTNFCPSCGSKKPSKPKVSFCGNCGFDLNKLERVPKFCPNCGQYL